MHCWGKCWVVLCASFPARVSKRFCPRACCVGALVGAKGQWLSLPMAMGVLQHSTPPHHRIRTAFPSILPMLPSGPIAHNSHNIVVAYYQLLCQRAVVTSPHNTFISLLLLLLFCLPLLEPHALLFNYAHVQILPKCSQKRFPLAAHACCPSLPLSTSATMGSFELCAWQCVCAGNKDLAGKGQPKRHIAGDMFFPEMQGTGR